jgi:hypothetical protein
MKGGYTPHYTCTSRRVSEKRDSALQVRKFLFFWQEFFRPSHDRRFNIGDRGIDILGE